jgi:hypothetical protein
MRQKIFGMIAVPLDRNAKARLLHRARALMRATEQGRHYGVITAKCYAVYAALLMGFHNNDSGRCFPSYDAIAEAAGCCRRTVAMALAALEAAGLLSVANRLVRVKWRDELAPVWRTRVIRTSNCYAFAGTVKPSVDARGSIQPSKGNLPSGTGTQVFNSDLFASLDRFKEAFEKANGSRSGWKASASP